LIVNEFFSVTQGEFCAKQRCETVREEVHVWFQWGDVLEFWPGDFAEMMRRFVLLNNSGCLVLLNSYTIFFY